MKAIFISHNFIKKSNPGEKKELAVLVAPPLATLAQMLPCICFCSSWRPQVRTVVKGTTAPGIPV